MENVQNSYTPNILGLLHFISVAKRAEALKHYKLAFDSRPNAARIYFDFSRDCLHFQYADTFSVFPFGETLRTIGNDLARVRFMSFGLHAARPFPMSYLPDLKEFKALEEIILLIPPGGHNGPDRIFVDPSMVTLSPTSNFRAIVFIGQDQNQFAKLWSDAEFRDFPTQKISIMSHVSGDYRIC